MSLKLPEKVVSSSFLEIGTQGLLHGKLNQVTLAFSIWEILEP